MPEHFIFRLPQDTANMSLEVQLCRVAKHEDEENSTIDMSFGNNTTAQLNNPPYQSGVSDTSLKLQNQQSQAFGAGTFPNKELKSNSFAGHMSLGGQPSPNLSAQYPQGPLQQQQFNAQQ